MPHFADNFFSLLGIAPAIRLDDAAEAKDDAVFDGRLDASTADEAMRLIGDPRLRLEAELGWPLDAGDLADPGLPERLAGQPIGSAARDAPLARMLLLSQEVATGRLNVDATRIIEVAELWQAILPETITQLVNDARVKAAIPVAAPDQVADALNRRRNKSARDLLASLDTPEIAGQVLADAVRRGLTDAEPGPFLSDLVQRHTANSEAALQALEEEFDRIDRAVRAIPDKAFSQLPSLQGALQRWDRINQPVQLLEQYRGHEEERSLALGRRLRGLAVDMTNEHAQPLFSDSLVRILLETFPQLEGLSATLRNDQQALAPLVAAASRARAIQPDPGPRKAAPTAPVRTAATARPAPDKGSKGWLWGLAAAIVAAFWIYTEDTSSRSTSSRRELPTGYSPSVSISQATPAPVHRTSPIMAQPLAPQNTSTAAGSSVPAPTLTETMPAIGYQHILNASEILYCLNQRNRLGAMNNIGSAAHETLNTLIDDFNRRCANYRYNERDLATARQAVNTATAYQEAMEILRTLEKAAPAAMQAPTFTDSGDALENALRAAMQAPTANNSSDVLEDALRAAGVPAEQNVPDPANLRDRSVARAAQTRLRDLGFLPADGVDGRFGRGSAAALRNFKASRGLPANDVWDYQTQEELFR